MCDILTKAIVLLGILALMAGCSFSYSSGTSSDSSKSSSNSSTSSSPSGTDQNDAKTSYMSDVSAYTTSAAKGANAEGYMRELGSIAKGHGITDWERDTATYNAIGTGI